MVSLGLTTRAVLRHLLLTTVGSVLVCGCAMGTVRQLTHEERQGMRKAAMSCYQQQPDYKRQNALAIWNACEEWAEDKIRVRFTAPAR